jgi:hypothetical protein
MGHQKKAPQVVTQKPTKKPRRNAGLFGGQKPKALRVGSRRADNGPGGPALLFHAAEFFGVLAGLLANYR